MRVTPVKCMLTMIGVPTQAITAIVGLTIGVLLKPILMVMEQQLLYAHNVAAKVTINKRVYRVSAQMLCTRFLIFKGF